MTFTITELIDLKHKIYDNVDLDDTQRTMIEFNFDMLIKSKKEDEKIVPTWPIPRGSDYMYSAPIPMPTIPDSSGTIKC